MLPLFSSLPIQCSLPIDSVSGSVDLLDAR